MATKTKQSVFGGHIPTSYSELVAIHPPRPIHHEDQFDNTMEIINALAGLPLNPDQEDYLDALSTFVEIYEDEHIEPPEKTSAIEMLRVVCEETDTPQVKVAEILGVSEGLVSLILKGERQITLEHAKALAKHFNVDPTLFLDL